jgi:hypothetical protein
MWNLNYMNWDLARKRQMLQLLHLLLLRDVVGFYFYFCIVGVFFPLCIYC